MGSRFLLALALAASAAVAPAVASAAEAPETTGTLKKPLLKTGLAGILGASYWGNRGSVTLGGPRLMVAFDGLSAGVSFFPSLYLGKRSDYRVIPALGFGPELTVRHLVFFMPIYFVGNRYRPLVGVGYEF